MTTTIPEQTDRLPEHGMPADMHVIASARTLDGFAVELSGADGVDVRELAAGTIVIMRTPQSFIVS